MKPVDHALQRLFRAAARGSEVDAAEVMPPELEARILTAFSQRLAGPAGEEVAALIATIRRGLVAAALVALITAVVCHRFDTRSMPALDSLVLDSVIELSQAP